MKSLMNTDSIIDSLKVLVDNRSLLPNVVKLLLPDGKPLDCEGQLWDYKVKAPILDPEPSTAKKEAHKVAIAEMVKDAVSFHNAYGGYLVFGIKDKGRNRLVGVEDGFNCADFNKTLQSYTGVSIECLYNVVEWKPEGSTSPLNFGLLLIPRRASGVAPIKLVRKGPEKPNGRRCFHDEIYIRIRDECRAAANTHEDWQFLHSDRLPPEQMASSARVQVQAHLPARDPDLVEFVGRSEQLASLRQWIADVRSPVRLITGIGGLGKTTLAYHFAEEVSKTGAGEVESVIWLTAKQQTFSALRGKMVPTSRVDFADIGSLFNSMLKVLSYEFPIMEEEPSLNEISDRLVEALSTIPSLVIIDDLDTLPPDEQKETVAALNSLALRTVGRDLPPSRVLMTSRLDQGLPLTAIVKIKGLELDDFDTYLSNLCAMLGISPFRKAELELIFEASSGSPLFAASILRLIKLGEDRKDVLEKWKGADGEEVRSFAFQRELARLSSVQSRVLYAVMLLGETTLNDIAEILNMSSRVVRDQVSELQAYHLISTITRAKGDSALTMPNELQPVLGLIREQLGSFAKSVEEAVALAHAKSGNQEREVGTSIRAIARSWAEDKHNEALIIAQDLRRKFPENADVASVLGAAFLRIRPPKYREADRELERAVKLGCTKPELLSNVIQAKSALEDWSGLQQYARTRMSNEFGRDIALNAHLTANSKLISIARERGDSDEVARLSIEAVERITVKIQRARLEPNYFNILVKQRFDYASAYVDAIERGCARPGDKLKVFEAVSRLANADLIVLSLLEKGVTALEQWWGDVEKRRVADIAVCTILNRMLGKLESIEQRLAGYKKDATAPDKIESRRRALEFRGGALQASIG